MAATLALEQLQAHCKSNSYKKERLDVPLKKDYVGFTQLRRCLRVVE